nr:reverse transcriptase domain-containing protein [Tanacetum cinerariifolium]
MMTTVNQGMIIEEIERVVAQRVANAIEAIAIYETKTNLARKSMSQTERQEEEVVENASNKRKWEGNHNGSSNQQNKGHKVPRAHTAWPINKKAYARSLPLCNQCKFHHSGSYAVPGAAPVARAPYRLAPFGMKDLSEQLKELSDKGIIRPSFLTMGSSSPICQKEGWIKPNETFNEAWERFKDLLRQCPHHGFSELHQLDTFYNALNPKDQDALDSTAGGNFLDKIPRECLSIIESKSKQIAASLEDKLDIHMNRFEKSLNDMKILSLLPLHQSRKSR